MYGKDPDGKKKVPEGRRTFTIQTCFNTQSYSSRATLRLIQRECYLKWFAGFNVFHFSFEQIFICISK